MNWAVLCDVSTSDMLEEQGRLCLGLYLFSIWIYKIEQHKVIKNIRISLLKVIDLY